MNTSDSSTNTTNGKPGLSGAAGSAADLLEKWNRLMTQRRDSLESRDIHGIEQALGVIRTDTDILLSFMQGTLKMLAAQEAGKPNNELSR